jgi:hypothetical protein
MKRATPKFDPPSNSLRSFVYFWSIAADCENPILGQLFNHPTHWRAVGFDKSLSTSAASKPKWRSNETDAECVVFV